MSNTLPAFGLLLKRYRKSAGLTQDELAAQAGLSVRGISDLERGARERPHRDTVQLLAEALKLSAEDRARLFAAARPHGPVVAAHPAGPGNLPVPLTSLIGRAGDARAVGQLLRQPSVRLVTLTGPGGVGKTRLALQVAADLHESFPDGTFFVALAVLRDPAAVLPTILHTLGVAETSGEQPLARLIAHLGTKQLLLVLDNFEHLLTATSVVSDLLAACPAINVLATSRERLHLSGEREFIVAPLALPDVRRPLATTQRSPAPALALFVERMQAREPQFMLTADNARSIAEICVRLDGLPLAIELAAARAKYLALPDLAARLDHRLQLLTHGPRDLPARQRTLRDTITWSYDLLAPAEQRLLCWLAVFAGGWTLASAEALCAGAAGLPLIVLDGLAALVDSSLVHSEAADTGPTRYEMLETIREFAEEHLIASGEAVAVQRQHAEVMLAFTDQAERGLQSSERTVWSRAALAEVDNVRAALRWSLDHGEVERALRIVGNLDWFWDAVGRDIEGWAWCNEALAREPIDRDGWGYARALNAAGAIAWNMGEFARSAELLTESVACFRALGDQRSLAQALVNLGLTVLYQGDADTGRQLLAEGVEHLEAVDDPWNLGLALFGLGEALLARDASTARAAYERSLAVFRSVGEPWGIALGLTALGGLAMRARDYTTAGALLEEGLALRRSINNPHSTAISLTSLGELARREGDDARAAAYLHEGLALFRDLGDREHIAWTLYNLGLVAVRREDAAAAATTFNECLTLRASQGNAAEIARTIAGAARVVLLWDDAEQAALLYGAVEAIRAAHGVSTPVDEDGEVEAQTVALVYAALDTDVVDRAVACGRALPLPEAIRCAENALDTARHAR